MWMKSGAATTTMENSLVFPQKKQKTKKTQNFQMIQQFHFEAYSKKNPEN